jgi:pimeloyl-ACP methyl ester carboxylesterase
MKSTRHFTIFFGMPIHKELFIDSDELRLWSERFGAPEDPAVLLIMGTSAQGIGWPDELVGTLVTGGRQVIRFDHRDTGRSSCVDFATHPYTPADMAADALAVLDGHGIAAAHVVGASLGGTIAQWLAAHRPERVLTLTIIMSSPMGANAGPARPPTPTTCRRPRPASCGTSPSGRPCRKPAARSRWRLAWKRGAC